MKAKTHKDLDVWKLSMEFIKEIYTLTEQFPDYERYCLTQQIRRAVLSISSNIAEGSARPGIKERIRFLSIAMGSLSEVDTQLETAAMLGYFLDINEQRIKIIRIRQMLSGLIKSLKSREQSSSSMK